MGELISVKKYSPEYEDKWDTFVDASKNGSFHLKRGFVEYHSHRFTDHSLLIFEGDHLKSIVPANIRDNILYSHQGLTYGGILVNKDLYLTQYIQLMHEMLSYLKAAGIEKFIIKEIPHTYTSALNDDFNYLMHLTGAKTTSFDVLPHVSIQQPIDYQTRRKRSINKALGLGMEVRETDDLEAYWEILSSVLAKHQAKPVHSLEEIRSLKNKFPNNIRLFTIHESDQAIAGVLVFETNRVARTQYIASSERGKETGALDLLFHELITRIFKDKPYLDFGTSTLHGGFKLNFGLSDQKEGFGARTVVQHAYEIDLKSLNFSIFGELKL